MKAPFTIEQFFQVMNTEDTVLLIAGIMGITLLAVRNRKIRRH